jgi:hypothetical protein
MEGTVTWQTQHGMHLYTLTANPSVGTIEVFDGRLHFICGIHTLKQTYYANDVVWTIGGADNMGLAVSAVCLTQHTPAEIVQVIQQMYNRLAHHQSKSLFELLCFLENKVK